MINHVYKNSFPSAHTSFSVTYGQAIPMTVLTYAVIGFVAGLFTMIIISLYRYVIKTVHR